MNRAPVSTTAGSSTVPNALRELIPLSRAAREQRQDTSGAVRTPDADLHINMLDRPSSATTYLAATVPAAAHPPQATPVMDNGESHWRQLDYVAGRYHSSHQHHR
eukprot:3906441-Amphidinium_carterae.2